MAKVFLQAAPTAAPVCGLCLQAAAQTTFSAESLVEPQGPPILNFPKEFTADGGRILLHVPQVDTWQDFAKVTGRFPIEITPDGEKDWVMGVAGFEADEEANLEERVVAVDNTRITVTSFPVADDSRCAQLDRLVRGVVQQRNQ